jgi:serine/threonine protein kinase
LGLGAIGVTCKAFDVDLRCPVTLKSISEKYLGDESARLRFLREARAAASVRHPNVASVFHLGKAHHDVARFDVPMNQLQLVHRSQSGGDLRRDFERQTLPRAGPSI